MNKKTLFFVLMAVFILVFAVLAIDYRLNIVYYTIENEHNEEQNRIVLITDLHSCSYGGEDMSELLDAVRAQNPDAVLLGGDIFDSRRMPETNSKTVLKALGKEFDCYYISGNHEVRHEKLEYYKDLVRSCGITVLEGECISDFLPGIDLYGFDDITAYADPIEQFTHLSELVYEHRESENFALLLTHNPAYFDTYSTMGYDLILCGHVHGGQWRIPGIINGIYAPGQGIFPKYAGGYYKENETEMIISRGLAKESSLIPRIFNRPELVVIDIT